MHVTAVCTDSQKKVKFVVVMFYLSSISNIMYDVISERVIISVFLKIYFSSELTVSFHSD